MSRRHVVWPWVLVGMVAALPALALVVLRMVPVLQLTPTPGRAGAVALLASFIGYGVIGWAVALVCLLVAVVRARRGALAVLAVLAAAGLALQLSWVMPSLTADGRPSAGPPFTVLSLNLRVGKADPDQVVAQAARADIVVLLEVTPAANESLAAAGLGRRFPYQVGNGNAGVSGTSVYSRYPVRAIEELPTSFQQWVTVVDVPQTGPVTVLAVHPCNPFCGAGTWWQESERVRQQAIRYLDGPTVVAGDFNAVDDHLPMQRLRRDGYASASDVAGVGPVPTYPANGSFPPLIGIDHVMISSHLTATGVAPFTVAGTDHRGLLATLAPAGPAR